MIISAITIENFKSIKKPVRIELRPITLLFGPNSAGKSTIIQALHYVRELLTDTSKDIDRTKIGGDHIRLGGFANLINDHDLSKTMRFRFELSLGTHPSIFEDCFDENELDEMLESFLAKFPVDQNRLIDFYKEKIMSKNHPWIEIKIKMNSMGNLPFIEESSIGFGKDTFVSAFANEKFEKDDRGKEKRIVELTHIEVDTSNKLLREEERHIIEELFGQDNGEDGNDQEISLTFSGVNKFTYYFGQSTLPHIEFKCSYNEYFDGKEIARQDAPDCYLFFEELLNGVWNLHLNIMLADLNGYRYIGPLREVPAETSFDDFNFGDPANWANGLAAWIEMDIEHPSTEYYINEINYWLSNDKFNTGYKLVRKRYKEIDVSSPLYSLLVSERTGGGKEVVDQLNNLPIKSKVFFTPEGGNIELHPKNIGIGISQLIPIIPFALQDAYIDSVGGIFAVEQPELHIHPSMQTVLGDLFIEGLHEIDLDPLPGKKRFILETHSEHLLLRLLRRLWDHGDLAMFIDPEDLGINFLEPSKNGMKAIQIRVSEEGKFKDPWPRGFFNERAEELF
jgi:hypothetical protein